MYNIFMKNELIYFAKKIYEQGMSPAQSGNISVLDDENNILITASGSASGDLEESDIVKIDFEGNLLDGDKKPSSEKLMHSLIYKKRPSIRAIIHSHSPEITAFAVSGAEINEVIMPEFTFYFGSIPLSKYYMPSSKELADDVSKLFENKNAVLMKNHGIVVGGKNLKEAFYSLESIQAYCKTYLYSKLLGKVCTLNKKQIKEIESLKK